MLTFDISKEITDQLIRLALDSKTNPYINPTASLELLENLDASMLDFIHTLKQLSHKHHSFLIRKLPIDPDLPSTPEKKNYQFSFKNSLISEFSLLFISLAFGRLMHYPDEKQGHYIHNIYPVKGLESAIANFGSHHEFNFHTEMAWDIHRPDYIGLLGLRNTHNGPKTILVDFKKIFMGLTRSEQTLLTNAPVLLKAPASFEKITKNEIKPIRMRDSDFLSGLNFNPGMMESDDSKVNAIFEKINIIASKEKEEFIIRPGELMLFNNHEFLHGRTSFFPAYDGNDRWLQRVYIHKEDNQ